MNSFFTFRYLVLVFAFGVLLFGCKTTSRIQDRDISDTETVLLISSETKDDIIKFEIKNNSDTIITIYNPKIKTIEKLENNKWVLQRILYCPCGARCQPAQKRMELQANQVIYLQWNFHETWCETDKNAILATKKEFAVFGKYRIKIKYEREVNNIVTLYKEFEFIK